MTTKVLKKALDDWREGEIAGLFYQVCLDREKDCLEARSNVFYPGEPSKTQEHLALLIGEQAAYRNIADFFDGEYASLFNPEEVEIVDLEEKDGEH